MVYGILYFALIIYEDSDTELQRFSIDIPYKNIELYLNGYKLTYKLDYFLKFPYLCITIEKYIDYAKTNQDIHIRMYGFTLEKEKINELEIVEFINHGVLLNK
jgi:hypothetical protein